MHIEDGLYAQIIDCMPIACVDVAIVCNGHILMVVRNDKPAQDMWWLPGGRVYKGETMVGAAHRKALEEVGLDCFVGPMVHTAETIFPDGPHDTSIHSINSCFLLYPKTGTGNLKLDEHHGDFRFVSCVESGLHAYVKACLRACGLNDESKDCLSQ